MDQHSYEQFTARLLAQAQRDDQVLGLVAMGSMAAPQRRDRWSDHDFAWIVRTGSQEGYRQHLDWLPDADQIVLTLRETEHGLKVFYANGHLIEFAVFDLEELGRARANDYAVLLDRADITARMQQVLAATEPPPLDLAHELAHVLSLIQVGTGRYARGEQLSGHIFIKSYALGHLLRLLAGLLPSEQVARLDNLDAFRRFEQVEPRLGAELNELLLRDVPACAAGLLDLIERELRPRLADFPEAALAALRQHLASIMQPGGTAQ